MRNVFKKQVRDVFKKQISLLLAVLMIFGTINLPVPSFAADVANHVIISQVYGGGGNSGAPYTNDFIELYNPTGTAVDLTGWTVQYASSSATGTFSNMTILTGTINPGEYYLIQEAAGSAASADLPTPNEIGSVGLGGSSGKVVLASNSEAITGLADTDVVDFVGYGGSTIFEGSGPTPTLSSSKSAIRKIEGVDTDDNAADFEAVAPNPRSGAPIVETKCATPTVNIGTSILIPGTEITFASTTESSIIEYNTVSVDETTWTTGSTVEVNTDTVYYVRAKKDGIENSDVATFTYTVNDTEPVSIASAKAEAMDTENIKIKGIISYVNYKNVSLQDSTGAIGLYLTANAANLKVGDEVIVIGKLAAYKNLIQFGSVKEVEIKIVSSDNDIPDRGTATIAELIAIPEGKTAGFDHMSEIINVEGAVLTDTATLTQGESNLMISPAVDLSSFIGVSVGDSVNVKLRMSDNRGVLIATIINMTKVGDENKLLIGASPNSGSVLSDSTVAINCNDVNAAIYYTLDGSDPTIESSVYADSITITGNIGDVVTLKAFAKSDGKVDSEILTAEYTIKDPNASLNIKEVLALTSGATDVLVTGQIVYFATAYGNPIIQSVIDGETYSLYVFGAAPDGAKIGDTVKMKGTYTIYGGLPELTSVISKEIVSSDTPIAAQEITISELNANGLTMLGRFVKIKDVTLGAYDAKNTTITDATGTINIYKATSYPVQVLAGDVVDVYAMVACYNTTVQLYVGTNDANGFNIYDVANDTKAPLITISESYLDAKPNQDYTVAIKVEDNKGVKDVKATYTIGELTVSDQTMTYDETSQNYKYTITGDQITSVAKEVVFSFTATDVTELKSTSELTVLIDNSPHITTVLPERNGSTGDEKSPLISVSLKNAGNNPTVKLTLKKDDVTIIDNQDMTVDVQDVTYTAQTTNLADGNYNASVTVMRSDSESVTATWSFTVGTAKYKAYFGQLHAHTAQYSDGSGTLADGLNYLSSIPSSDNVDFVSFTDHSNYFDTKTEANPAGALNDKSKMTAPSLAIWDSYVSAMDTFNNDNAGSLIAFPGFEMTWSGGPGHINTFNSLGVISRNDSSLNNKTGDAGMKAYYDTLIQNTDPLANLSQFNHPGTTFGTFSDFAYWSPSYDNKMVAVEVGNGEGAIGSGGNFTSYKEYTKALDKGWHVSPTNNQDNHKGHWGNANTARTVIITDQLSKTGLLEGLKNMSLYATEDKNLNINYTVNDQMMGSIITEIPQTALQFVVNVDDPDSDEMISKIEIVSNGGRVVASKSFDSNVADWSFELPSIQGYYYVRVTQADLNMAVTSPVWIGQAPLVGMSSFETTTKLPVTDEALNFKTTLFNNEKDTVTVKSIEYKQGDVVLDTKTMNDEMVSSGTQIYNFEFTPTKASFTELTVTAVVLVNEQEKTFTQKVEFLVRDAEKLVYVGIDASNHNEYVNGNYKDSMGNFANLAVESDVRVVELKTEEELIAATQNPKYAMIILTPPTRRNGNAFLVGYDNYSDAEIAAIKAFAEAGKTVIITGWGDYYESYTKYADGTVYDLPDAEQMSAQQNKLLAAIGSNLRVSDDEIKDDSNNGGSIQRLYLTEYNLNNEFLKNVSVSEQVFSCYAGSTIYAVDENSQPSTILPSTVVPMVSGFTTSYSSDDDKDGTTGIEGVSVPKYSDKHMVVASEKVTYENGNVATVIVGGSAFMSNFEVQVTMDSYATPAYSNYTILENIINSINIVDITKISEVQLADEGEIFTIQGIVTSNASGFDKDTAFFDCIYLQDETAGINAFPVAGDIRSGQLVQITGITSSYNGERQIAVKKITIIDGNINSLPAPIVETTADAANGNNLGSIVKISGTITSIEYSNNVVESIYVKDSSNEVCRVFIDGYITKDKTITNLVVGAKITATGLSSIDTLGSRIRIRDRADIFEEIVNNKPKKDKKDKKDSTTPATETKELEDLIPQAGAILSNEDQTKLSGDTKKIIEEMSKNAETAKDADKLVIEMAKTVDKIIATLTTEKAAEVVAEQAKLVGKVLNNPNVDLGDAKEMVKNLINTNLKNLVEKDTTGKNKQDTKDVKKDVANLVEKIIKKASTLVIAKSNVPATSAIKEFKLTSTELENVVLDALKTKNEMVESLNNNGMTDVADLVQQNINISLPEVKDEEEVSLLLDKDAVSSLGEKNVGLTVEAKGVTFTLPASLMAKATSGITVESKPLTSKEKSELNSNTNSGKTTELKTLNLEVSSDVEKIKGEVTLSFSVGDIAQADLDKLMIGVFEGDKWVKLNYEIVGDQIVFKAPHFSIYSLMTFESSFEDTNTSFAKSYINSLTAKGIVSGKSDTSFDPEATLTRAEFTTLLVKYLGLTDEVKTNFKDVDSSKWYYDYVGIAGDNGITSGSKNGLFMPDEAITREDMAVMLYRSYNLKYGFNLEGGSLPFSDNKSISESSKEAVYAARANGLISGYEDNTFRPNDFATRAEAATILYLLLEK